MADVFGCLHDFVSVKETSLITTKTQASLPFPTGSGFVHGSAPSPTSEGDPISLSQRFPTCVHGTLPWHLGGQNYFTLSHYLSFSLSFFCEYTLGFSRGCHVILQIKCRNRYENPAVFYTARDLQKYGTMPQFSLNFQNSYF